MNRFRLISRIPGEREIRPMFSLNRQWPGSLAITVVLFPCGAGAQTVGPEGSWETQRAVLEPGTAPGQEADPLTSLRSTMKAGERVRVIDRSGRSTSGRLVVVLPSAIRLVSGAITREVPRDDIALIRRDGDSLWNGSVWGAAVGTAVALKYIGDVNCTRCSTAETVSVSLALGGIGAGLGVLLDLMVRDEQILYQGQQAAVIIERVKDSFLVAPDFKVSRVNDSFAGLAGGYGGRLIHNSFLIGAGGYWLANGDDKVKMRYGEVVLGWRPQTSRRLAFGARGLFGFGTHDSWLSHPLGELTRHGQGFYVKSGLVVAEPQADLVWTLTDSLRLNGGVGYRLVGASETDRLGGITGSVALQFGGP